MDHDGSIEDGSTEPGRHRTYAGAGCEEGCQGSPPSSHPFVQLCITSARKALKNLTKADAPYEVATALALYIVLVIPVLLGTLAVINRSLDVASKGLDLRERRRKPAQQTDRQCPHCEPESKPILPPPQKESTESMA